VEALEVNQGGYLKMRYFIREFYPATLFIIFLMAWSFWGPGGQIFREENLIVGEQRMLLAENESNSPEAIY